MYDAMSKNDIPGCRIALSASNGCTNMTISTDCTISTCPGSWGALYLPDSNRSNCHIEIVSDDDQEVKRRGRHEWQNKHRRRPSGLTSRPTYVSPPDSSVKRYHSDVIYTKILTVNLDELKYVLELPCVAQMWSKYFRYSSDWSKLRDDFSYSINTVQKECQSQWRMPKMSLLVSVVKLV
jgi:hypothetical protein